MKIGIKEKEAMMKKYAFILWAALTMTGAFTACTDNESPMSESIETKTVTIRATIDGDIGSRVDLTDNAENRSVKVDWKQGDGFKINVDGEDYTFTYNEHTGEFAYDGQNELFPTTFTSAGTVTATYPATTPMAYGNQSGTLEGAAGLLTMTATLAVEAGQSTENLNLVFKHTTSIVKLTLTNEAFKNQNVGVKLYAENLLLDKGGHLITGNGTLRGDVNGSVTAYFAVPGHSIDETYQSLDCRIYATVGSTTYRTNLIAKYLFAGKLYNVVKDDLTVTEDFQSTAMLLPTGRNFNVVVGKVLEANTSLKKIKFVTNSQNASGTLLFTDVSNNTMYAVANGEWLEIHTSAVGFQANTDCGGMFRGITTGTYQGNSRFAAVTEINLTGVNTSGVTDMYNMFGVCSNLTTLTLGNDFNTANVKDMGSMFSSCSKLTSLDLSGFNTANVTDMRSMFSSCSQLTSLDLSGFNTANVTDMGSMFSSCSNLATLTFGNNFSTAKVTNMSWMFSSCSQLTSLDLTNFSFEGNPSVNVMFNGTGSSADNKPITIKVTLDGYNYLSNKNTNINSDYAKLEHGNTDYVPV